MTKNEMWEALVERHPDFLDPDFVVKLRARGLRRLVEQAWDEGFEAGVGPTDNPFPGLFGDLWNKPPR